jgi:repressor LexA
MAKLSDRQQRILEFIRSEVATKGIRPQFGRSATRWVLGAVPRCMVTLTKLEELGYIRRDLSKPEPLSFWTIPCHPGRG